MTRAHTHAPTHDVAPHLVRGAAVCTMVATHFRPKNAAYEKKGLLLTLVEKEVVSHWLLMSASLTEGLAS